MGGSNTIYTARDQAACQVMQNLLHATAEAGILGLDDINRQQRSTKQMM